MQRHVLTVPSVAPIDQLCSMTHETAHVAEAGHDSAFVTIWVFAAFLSSCGLGTVCIVEGAGKVALVHLCIGHRSSALHSRVVL